VALLRKIAVELTFENCFCYRVAEMNNMSYRGSFSAKERVIFRKRALEFVALLKKIAVELTFENFSFYRMAKMQRMPCL